MKRMKNSQLNIGIVGAGGFSGFATRAFCSLDGVSIVAVNDLDRNAAQRLAAGFGATVFDDFQQVLKQKEADLIYIATPPFMHYEQTRQALLAGKHVICEKPAALNVTEAEKVQALARSLQLLNVVNLMQRYNPLYTTVKKIIDRQLLGNFLHGYFENYASDENLDPGHWFWNEAKSGGIFIEHGVHFFDMFAGWFGRGEVINAIQLKRPGSGVKIVDRVQATVLYDKRIVNFYHGFDQPKILDRQQIKLQFEKGDITLYEWVPVKMVLEGLVTHKDLRQLEEIIGDVNVERMTGDPERPPAKGRFSTIQYDEHVVITSGNKADKQNRYADILRAMLLDQWAWIKNPEHKRIVDDTNAVESLRMAERATQLAKALNKNCC